MNFVVLLLLLVTSKPVTTKRLSPCSCQFGDEFYNLRPLASTDGPALEVEINGYEYGYNPCIPFTVGPKGSKCTDVAICKWVDNVNFYRPLGLQTNVSCRKTSRKGIVELIYQQPGSQGLKTKVQLICNKDMKIAKLTTDDKASPTLQVEHRCCCPNTCYDFQPLPTSIPAYKEAAIIGGSVGGVAFIAIIVGCIYWWRKKRRRPPLCHPRGHGYQAIGGADGRGGGDDVRGGGDDVRGGGDEVRGGGDDARGGGDARVGGDDARGGGDDARVGGDDVRGGGDDIRGGGDDARGGGDDVRGFLPAVEYLPNVPDNRLTTAVEEQNPQPDDEHGRGGSASAPIQVAQDPECQCSSDDESSFRPQSNPVEHSMN